MYLGPDARLTVLPPGTALPRGTDLELVAALGAVVAAERHHGLEPVGLARSLSNYGTALIRSGRYAEAIDALRESEAIFSELMGPDPVVLAFPRNGLGDALAALGRSAEAEAVYRAARDADDLGAQRARALLAELGV